VNKFVLQSVTNILHFTKIVSLHSSSSSSSKAFFAVDQNVTAYNTRVTIKKNNRQ